MDYAKDEAGSLVCAYDLSRQPLPDRSFTCPGCQWPVTYKPGIRVSPHFAHKPGAPDCVGGKESLLHFNMKYFILSQLLENKYDSPELEYNCGDVRADVWCHIHGGSGVAFECQVTNLNPRDLLEKLQAYSYSYHSILYVVPLQLIGNLDGYEYRMQEWLKILHSIYFGRIYAYWDRHVIPIHLDWTSRTFAILSRTQAVSFAKGIRSDLEPGRKYLESIPYSRYQIDTSSDLQFKIARFSEPNRFWPR